MAAQRTRSDAVRNRAVILAAAERLFAETADGPGLSTDEIAAAAGVGKGTVFRAFGDRAGLLRAVYEARFATLRPALLGDEAGGAAPRERVRALLEGITRAKIDNRQLMLALEDAGGQRKTETLFETPQYRWAHSALKELLEQCPHGVDPALTAHVLLSAVRADLLEHLLADGATTEQEVLDGIRALVDRLLPEDPR